MKVLIVSDMHANWPALSAVVTREPYNHLICVGDVVYEQGEITLKQVAYNVEATIAGLQRGPLSAAVVERLATLLRA